MNSSSQIKKSIKSSLISPKLLTKKLINLCLRFIFGTYGNHQYKPNILFKYSNNTKFRFVCFT